MEINCRGRKIFESGSVASGLSLLRAQCDRVCDQRLQVVYHIEDANDPVQAARSQSGLYFYVL